MLVDKTFRNYITPILQFLILAWFSIGTSFAASTGTTNLLLQSGSGYATTGGDYISSSGGLNTYYRYFIEVPPGTANLTIEIYDADVGAVTTGNYTDWPNGGFGDTSCNYSLRNPAGTSVANQTYNNTQTTADSAWVQLYTVANPTAGHWELRVNMSSAITTGNDYNGYGIRAHDGTSGAGGTELNIYAHSFIPLGVVGANPTTKTTTFYPYVVSGCTVDWNNFDGDDDGAGTYCRLSYASRVGSVSATYNGAANDAWGNRAITGFNTDFVNNENGLWTGTGIYRTLSGSTANFGVFYAGAYNASNPAPTSQPQANTFRVYLPTDSGGKPSKPILTQKVSWISGPNPPVRGSNTVVQVEIVVANPAAQAINFSGSNLVTSYMPDTGGRVTYQGNARVTHGSVTTQPAIGATSGTISWNPGTVNAGATAQLTYYVQVNPNRDSGNYYRVTGYESTSGTTATYTDETGNATFTLGPLCGLAVTRGGSTIPTWAAITRFGSCSDSGQPTVEWQTCTESGTVGYNLWRKDRESGEYEQVNPMLLPALANAPQGGAYRLADPGAFSYEPVTYKLEEIDAQGRSLMYGPFTVIFGGAPGQDGLDREPRLAQEEPTGIYGFQRFARAKSLYEEARLNARSQELSRATLQAGSGKERARVTVKGRGLFYVTAGQVASALGVSESLASSLINGHNLKLTALGKDVAWLADNSGAGLFFYNEGKETLYSDKNVYFIERGSGLAMDAVSGGNAGPAPDGQTYAETLRFNAGKYFLPSQDKDRLADDWMWEVVAAGGAGKTFALDVPGVAGSGQAKLRVVLRGATDTEAANDHHAVVKVNGTEIGSGYWDGGNDYALELTFSASQLTDGGNTVEVSGALDMGAPYSIFYVDSLELSYARRYRAVNNAIICKAGNNSVITVSGLIELQTVALELGNERRPRLVTGTNVDVSGRLTFVPRLADGEYLVSGLNAALRPISVVGDRPSTLKGRTRAAEYIVIAPEEFASAAQELADYRKGKGLKTLVVTLEDIYDAFSFGVTDPYAIRAFLAYANKNWGKVKYAVLAGKGTYDYNDYLGNGDNLVPALLAKSAYGYYAADRVYGDITGKNLVPEIAIGRLPAVTNAELRALIAKVKAYESGQGDWTGKALFIADDADDGGDFAQGCNDLAAIMTGYDSEKIVLAGSVSATNSKIVNSWNSGAALVTYCGHGGISQLAQENIFDADDAAALANGGQLPLATLLTCVAGRVEIPGYTSLAEVLALNSAGGMAGGLAPSGAALHEDSLKLAEEFYKAAYRAKAASAGEALIEAMKRYVQQGGKAELLNAYNWLGDPALSIK